MIIFYAANSIKVNEEEIMPIDHSMRDIGAGAGRPLKTKIDFDELCRMITAFSRRLNGKNIGSERKG